MKFNKIIALILTAIMLFGISVSAIAEADDPLVIAFCAYGLSTEYGDRGRQITQIAVDRVNAAGGINGKEVQIVYYDCGSDQQSYIDAYLKALEVDGVSAIIGTFYSAYALACTDYVNEAQIPTFNIATNFELGEASEYYYTNRCVDTAAANAMSQLALDNGVTKAISIFFNTSNGYNDNEFQKEYMARNGAEVVAEFPFDSKTISDYTSLVLQAMAVEGADGILMHSSATDGSGQQILTLLHEYGWKYPIIHNSNVFTTQFMETVGAEVVNGLIGYAEYAVTLDRPQIAQFEQMLQENGFTYDNTGWQDAAYYDVISLIFEAARLSGGNDKDSIQEGLHMIQDYEGVMSDYTYHEDGSYANNIYLASFDEEGNIIVSETLTVDHG